MCTDFTADELGPKLEYVIFSGAINRFQWIVCIHSFGPAILQNIEFRMWNGWKITRARFTEFRNASVSGGDSHMQRLLLMFEVSIRSFVVQWGYSQWSMHSASAPFNIRNSNLLTDSNECMSQFVHRIQFTFMDFMGQSAYNLYNNTNYATFNSITISHFRQEMASWQVNTSHRHTRTERKRAK